MAVGSEQWGHSSYQPRTPSFWKQTQKRWTWGKANFTWHQNRCLRKGYFWSSWPCIAQMSSHKINMAELQENPIRDWCRLQQHRWILVHPHPNCVQFHRIDFRLTKEFKISEMHVGKSKKVGWNHCFKWIRKGEWKLMIIMGLCKKYPWKARLTWEP